MLLICFPLRLRVRMTCWEQVDCRGVLCVPEAFAYVVEMEGLNALPFSLNMTTVSWLYLTNIECMSFYEENPMIPFLIVSYHIINISDRSLIITVRMMHHSKRSTRSWHHERYRSHQDECSACPCCGPSSWPHPAWRSGGSQGGLSSRRTRARISLVAKIDKIS